MKKPKNEAPLTFEAFVGLPGDPMDVANEFDRGVGVPDGRFDDFMDEVCLDGEGEIGGIDGSVGCAAMALVALVTETRGAWVISPEDACR